MSAVAALRWRDVHGNQLVIDSAIEVIRHGDGKPQLHEASKRARDLSASKVAGASTTCATVAIGQGHDVRTVAGDRRVRRRQSRELPAPSRNSSAVGACASSSA